MMEQLITSLLEQAFAAGVVLVLLWIFLPRLLQSIDSLSERNSTEHHAILLLINHLETRLTWHEARVYGVNPSTGSDSTEQQQAATDAFMAAADSLQKIREDINKIFLDAKQSPDAR